MESKQFSLTALDWKSIGKGALVALAGFGLTLVPLLAGFSYIWGGIDFTPFVVVILSVVANIVRKFVVDNSK